MLDKGNSIGKACVREYQITSQLNTQSINLENLSSIVNKLCDRLESICGTANLDNDGLSDKETLVKLAETLESNTSMIKYNIRVLEDLYNRIEL